MHLFTNSKLKGIIEVEKKIYSNYMFKNTYRYYISYLKREPIRMIWHWQKLSRKTDYYYIKKSNSYLLMKFLYGFLYFIYICRRNRAAECASLDVSTQNIGPGLLIYHGGVVVNCNAKIGENCHLHGDNCIGNYGPQDPRCPVIGDNVMLGVGAKVIGDVHLANNIKVAAGAVVVHSFYEEGVTIGGIPAKVISHG